MKTIATTAILFFAVSFCMAQSLWINDPQNWGGGAGTIEETKITYQPSGPFMKVDWEITFSAKGIVQFSEKDTVEVVYHFNLPEGAVIFDSWLWFGDTILKALIIDRWSANQVYENIVNRRRDPSVLYKNGATHYELRIFPMAAKEERKVKISFLTPANWSHKSVNAHFLAENLLVSKNVIENIEVFANLSGEWKNPAINGLETIMLAPDNNMVNGTVHYKKIDFKQLVYGQKFEVSSPMKEGYYLNFFENGDDKFYQLALFPEVGIELRTPRKLLFLIDFQKENTILSQDEMLKLFALEMKGLLNEKDSFNILYHDFELQVASKSWISGDSASVYDAIETLGDQPFVSYSNLATLLASGIGYAKSKAGSKIILLANSDRIDNAEAANSLISDLMKLMDPIMPIYIGDFQNLNYRYSRIKNINYRGNEYFYRNLAKLTGGDYVHSFDGETFSGCLNKTFQLATSENGLIDIHTTLENGFCFGRYILSGKSENGINQTHLQVGRYSGEFPFEVEISGLYNDEIFSKKLSIPKGNAFELDSLAATFWHGKEIFEMENSGDSYSLINDIIDKSIENRILSNYTAFLCLESSMLGELDKIDDKNVVTRGWDEEGAITVADEIETPAAKIKAYPNPFSDFINIEVQFPGNYSNEKLQLEIYDLFGKRLKVFDSEDFNGKSEIKITWDATDKSGNRLSKGTYLFICTTSEGRISKKLIVM